MYDTELIKQRISCVDIAIDAGLPISKAGDRCISPLRTGAKNPTSFCVDKDFWFDFGSGQGGDQIDLFAYLHNNGDKGRAIYDLAKLVGVDDDNSDTNQKYWKEYTQNLCNEIAHYQENLTESDIEYLHSRRINDDTIKKYKIGRTDSGRLCIPYLKNGYVAYYITRRLEGSKHQDKKYMKQYLNGLNEHIVWGLDTLTNGTDFLSIMEGAFDVLSFAQEGFSVLSAITGYFSKKQIPTVIAAAKRFKYVLLVYDNDPKTHAGDKFTQKMADLLLHYRIPFKVGKVPAPYHDVSEFYADGNKLNVITENSQNGLYYLCDKIKTFEDFETFVYKINRYTKKSDMIDIFDYVKNKFNEKQLKILLKSVTSPPPEDITADDVLKKHQIIYIENVGFYEYISGVWKKQTDTHIKSYILNSLGVFASNNRQNQVLGLLKTLALTDVQFNQKPVWNFLNGTLELDTGLFRKANPNDYCSIQVKYPYNPKAGCPKWKSFIETVVNHDPVSMEILQFIPGYALFFDCRHEKIFFLTGEGSNGKSLYLKILIDLFGEDNVTNLPPKAFTQQFDSIFLKDSILNIASEIKSQLNSCEESLKAVASGEMIRGCFKGKDIVQFKPRTKLIFAANGQITSTDTSDGLARRMIIIDFPIRFVDFPKKANERKKDTTLYEKLSGELSGIFNWAYNGYRLLTKVGYFTQTDKQTELLDTFKRASNPVLDFYDDFYDSFVDDGIIGKQTVYDCYRNWCEKTGHKPLAMNKFHANFKKASEEDLIYSERSVRTNNNVKKVRFYKVKNLNKNIEKKYITNYR